MFELQFDVDSFIDDGLHGLGYRPRPQVSQHRRRPQPLMCQGCQPKLSWDKRSFRTSNFPIRRGASSLDGKITSCSQITENDTHAGKQCGQPRAPLFLQSPSISIGISCANCDDGSGLTTIMKTNKKFPYFLDTTITEEGTEI